MSPSCNYLLYCIVMGCRTCYPKIWHFWILNKLKEFKNMADAEKLLWPTHIVLFPEIDHKILLRGALVYTKKRSILFSKDRGTLRRILMKELVKFPPVYYNYLILFYLSYSRLTPVPIKPSRKMHVCVFGVSIPYEISCIM